VELKKLIIAQLVREPTLFGNPEVYCPIHNSPPPVTILRKMNPVTSVLILFLHLPVGL
jgi:hypothetical protein